MYFYVDLKSPYRQAFFNKHKHLIAGCDLKKAISFFHKTSQGHCAGLQCIVIKRNPRGDFVRVLRCYMYITLDFAMAAPQNGFYAHKVSLSKKTNTIPKMT